MGELGKGSTQRHLAGSGVVGRKIRNAGSLRKWVRGGEESKRENEVKDFAEAVESVSRKKDG